MTRTDGEYSETYIERMDARRMEMEHKEKLEQIQAQQTVEVEKERAKAQRTEARWDTLKPVLIGLMVIAAVGGIAWTIYFMSTSGPEPVDHEHELEQACYADGGGWVPRDMLDDYIDDHGLCVMPRHKAAS